MNPIDRAEHTQRLLTELRPHLESLAAEYVAAWRVASDPAHRDDLWRLQHLLGKVESHLQTVIDDGALHKRALSKRGLR